MARIISGDLSPSDPTDLKGLKPLAEGKQRAPPRLAIEMKRTLKGCKKLDRTGIGQGHLFRLNFRMWTRM